MSRIRMAVEIRNESPFTLVWAGDELEVGDWTDPWFPSRTTAPPGATVEWRAEGGLILAPTTGTEGRVRYNVDGDPHRQLYIHFNSPLIESQYGNTFHVWAPPGFEAAWSGGQGHNARLTIRFRETAVRAVRGFIPSTNGFQFANSWPAGLPAMTVGFLWNRLLEELGDAAGPLGLARVDDDWLPLTEAAAGMCGGMAFATMDYFTAGQLPPATTTAPASGADPLFQFIRGRLLDSFDIFGSGIRWLAYSSPHYPNGDEGFIQAVGLTRGRAWVTYREEWPRIRDDIDSGRLSPIGLIQTDSLDVGKNHQVLAYAYRQSGQLVQLWICDSNLPGDDDLILEFDVTDTAGAVDVRRMGYPSAQPRIFCITRTDGYNPHSPPGGRALTVRQAIRRVTGRSGGRLPQDVNLARPASLRGWLNSV
jgi:hypothetical protein